MQEKTNILPDNKIIPTSADIFSAQATAGNDIYAGNVQRLPIKRNLSIGAVDDPMEYEADAMADTVMRMPEPNLIQRKCTHCAEEEVQRKPLASFVQRKEKEDGNTISDATHNQVEATRGGGSAMPANTKTFMESRFGIDFSNVRIHSGGYASQLSNQLNAQAFTLNNDIYFNSGKFSPEFSEGKHLLAHELTHTIQQSGNARREIQKKEMEFNPALIAVQLRNAMKGWGTDEAAIYAALSGRTPDQVTAITVQYKELKRRDLKADLEDELAASELKKLALYGQVLSDSPENRAIAVAIQLRDAMEGWGTDENTIYVSLQSRTEEELKLIQQAYFTLTKHQLMADLRDEFNDEEYNKATGTMGISPDVKIKNTELGMLSVGNFDFNLSNCKIEVEVRLKFQFTDEITEAERIAYKPRFINAVLSKWHNSGYKLVGDKNCPCREIPIVINVLENPSNYHKVVDVEKKHDSERRPFVLSDININLYSSDETFMHEFGHVLGLYDEYVEEQGLLPVPVLGRVIKFVGESFANAVWHRNRPDDIGSLMNQTGLELRPRFFEHYNRTTNENAPMGCNYKVSS